VKTDLKKHRKFHETVALISFLEGRGEGVVEEFFLLSKFSS